MISKTLLVFAFLGFCLCATSQTKNVLFLGNSYTFYNNMPGLVDSIAQCHGDTLLFDTNTPGGYSLEGHSTNATSIVKIQEGGWDFVVLQEQSQLPSFPIGQVEEDVFPYAEILVEEIRAYNDCAMPLFYMTWGRENGDASNCEFWPPVCTYEGMQELLTERYSQMGYDNESYISPVGEAWRLTRETYPEIQLYASDSSHPSYAGSYLAACVFYSSMWGEESSGCTFYGTLDSETAVQLQEMADATVFGEEDWNYYDIAGYSLEIIQSDESSVFLAQFNPYIQSLEITYDDNTATLADGIPFEVDLISANTELSVEVISNCVTSVDLFELEDLINSIGENNQNNYAFYPNPASSKLTITSDQLIQNIEIADLRGRVIERFKFSDTEVELSLDSMPTGKYLLRINYQYIDVLIIEK